MTLRMYGIQRRVGSLFRMRMSWVKIAILKSWFAEVLWVYFILFGRGPLSPVIERKLEIGDVWRRPTDEFTLSHYASICLIGAGRDELQRNMSSSDKRKFSFFIKKLLTSGRCYIRAEDIS